MIDRRPTVIPLLALLFVVGQASGISAQTFGTPVPLTAVGRVAPPLPPSVMVPPLATRAWGDWREDAQTRTRAASRDSLTNGAVIGAAVGAAAFAFAGVICKAEQEPDGPSCVPDTLRVAAIGAAIGLGAGLVIDVARSRNVTAVHVTLRF
jgi:hypothetical protein